MTDGERTWATCLETARLYTQDEGQATKVARLLLGTAAQESGFKWRRQLRNDGCPMPLLPPYGAYSLWQLEPPTVKTWLSRMKGDRKRDEVITEYVSPDSSLPLSLHSLESILKMLVGWLGNVRAGSRDEVLAQETNAIADRLGCCVARDHYLRVTMPIPEHLEDQAVYYKRFYNSPLGKATVEQYLANWNRLCVPVLDLSDPDPAA